MLGAVLLRRATLPLSYTLYHSEITMAVSAPHPQHAIQAQSVQDREAFWLRAAQDVHWHQKPSKAYGRTDRTSEYTNPTGKSKDTNMTWFPNASANTCFNCIDRHIYPPAHAGAQPLTASPLTPHLAYNTEAASKVAFHHVSPLPFQMQQYRKVTYAEALESIQTLSGSLKHLGIRKGDVVTIYMPMIPETAIAMLACARIGAIHSVVFGGFAPKELAKRIQDAKAKLVIAASCGLEPKGIVDYKPLVDEAIQHSQHKPSGLLFLRRHTIKDHHPANVSAPNQNGPSGIREYDWEAECDATRLNKDGRDRCWSCHPVASEDPLYTLYTSGTTGTPKGVVRLSGGHMVQLRYTVEHLFGMKPSDTMLCASDLGWVVGHSYILYAPLLLGASTVIFEGKPVTPDAGILWRTISQLQVTHLFTAPTALRAVRGQDPTGAMMRGPSVNLRTLRALFLAGERSEPQIVQVYSELLKELGAPGAVVNDNYWSTESGSPITALMLGSGWSPLTARPGSAGLPQPGMDVTIVDDEGKEVKQGEMGNLVLRRPLAPSALGGLWKNPDGFHKSYWSRFEGHGDWFDTGDAAQMDEAGYITILARADDIIQVAGHRLGTGLIEQVVTGHPDVVECCVVGAPDKMKGHVPFGLVVARPNHGSEEDAQKILQSINQHVRKEVGPIAQLSGLVITEKLPKTRSGKTLRKTVRVIVEQAQSAKQEGNIREENLPVPPTIEDRDCLRDNIRKVEMYFLAKSGTQISSKARL